MSRHVPVLTEVVVRAWGLDDPRVLPMLRAENQPGRYRRAKAIEQRAEAAGWPQEFGFGNGDGKKVISRAMRRLEGMDFSFQGRHRRHQLRLAQASPEGYASPDVKFRRESAGANEPALNTTSIYDE